MSTNASRKRDFEGAIKESERLGDEAAEIVRAGGKLPVTTSQIIQMDMNGGEAQANRIVSDIVRGPPSMKSGVFDNPNLPYDSSILSHQRYQSRVEKTPPYVKVTALPAQVQTIGKSQTTLEDSDFPKDAYMFRSTLTTSRSFEKEGAAFYRSWIRMTSLLAHDVSIFKQPGNARDGKLSLKDHTKFAEMHSPIGCRSHMYNNPISGETVVDIQVGGDARTEPIWACCNVNTITAGNTLAFRTVLRIKGLEDVCRKWEDAIVIARSNSGEDYKKNLVNIQRLLNFEIPDVNESVYRNFKNAMNDYINDNANAHHFYLSWEPFIWSGGGNTVPVRLYDFEEFIASRARIKVIGQFMDARGEDKKINSIATKALNASRTETPARIDWTGHYYRIFLSVPTL